MTHPSNDPIKLSDPVPMSRADGPCPTPGRFAGRIRFESGAFDPISDADADALGI